MENVVLRGDSGLVDVVVEELNCVRVDGGFFVPTNKLLALVVVEGGTDIETLARAEFP